MAIIDDIERFEAGASRIRAGAAGLTDRQDPVARPAPRPQVAARPVPSLGTRVGGAVRGAGTAIGGLATGYAAVQATNARNVVAGGTALPRAAGGFVRDAGRAIVGAPPSPSAGQPLGLPSLSRRPAPATQATVVPAANPSNWSPGPRARPRPAAAAPAAAAAAAAVPAVASTSDFNLQPGDVNTFTGADGVTKPVPGLLNAGTQPAPASAPVVATRPVPVQAPRGRQGAIIENPADSTADKLQRALTSSSLKGSPSARAAIAQAILGEASARQEERASALATGDRADLAAVDNSARIANENADRELAAQRINADLVEQRADRGARLEEQRIARRPDVTVSADGSMGIVGNDGRFTPVTDQTGRTVRAPQPRPTSTTQASPDAALKALMDARTAAAGFGAPEEGTPERQAYDARLADLDSQINGLLPGATGTGAPPTLEQFLAAARSSNPGVSDEALTSYYTQNYGR